MYVNINETLYCTIKNVKENQLDTHLVRSVCA